MAAVLLRIIAPQALQAAITIGPDYIDDVNAGDSYSATFTATGGTAPYTFRVSSGALPPGLSLAGAVLSGTVPVTADVRQYLFNIEAKDATGQTAETLFAVTVYPAAINLPSTTLPAGGVGVTYSATLLPAGGTGIYFFALESGNLPPGLSLSGAFIRGKPTALGSYNFTVKISDTFDNTASFALSISIGNFPLSLTPSTIPAGTVSTPYSGVTFSGSGGAGGYSYTLSGSLPQGMTFTADTLSGTPASSTAGTYPISVQVRDSVGATAQLSYSLVIQTLSGGGGGNSGGGNGGGSGDGSGGSSGGGGTVTGGISASVPALKGAVGERLTYAIQASGGTPPYNFVINSGTLPSGLTLQPNGVINGIPTATGTFTVTVRIADSVGTPFSIISVSGSIEGALAITTTSLPALTPYVPYSVKLAASGGVPPYLWSLPSGKLPAGFSLDSIAGTITGTFTGDGFSNFNIQVADSGGAIAIAAFSLGASNRPPEITTARDLPAAVYGRGYNTNLAASSLAKLTWTLIAGTLPPGITLSVDGVLNGTPTAAGTYIFTARATDPGQRSASREFSLAVSGPLTIQTRSPLPDAVAGTVSLTFVAAGGTPPYKWAIASGTPPPGVTLSAAGVLSGTATATGTYYFEIAVTDNVNAKSVVPYSLRVVQQLQIVTTPLAAGDADVPYSATLAASGGTSPYQWSATGLPAGFTLNAATGALNGVPAAGQQISFTARVADQNAVSATRAFTITIRTPPLAFDFRPLADGTVGVPYTGQLFGKGGVKPYSWNLVNGLLPNGVVLSPGGALSGTPQQGGAYTFTAALSDSTGAFVRTDYVLYVAPAAATRSLPALPEVLPPATQVWLRNDAGHAITVELSFAAADGADDETLRFGSGSRTAVIAPGEGVPLQTGTSAGVLTVRSGSEVATARVEVLAPEIHKVRAERVEGGIAVVVTGYATSHEVDAVVVTFAAGTALRFSAAEEFRRWFAGSRLGGQFVWRQTFAAPDSVSGPVAVWIESRAGRSAVASAEVR